MADNQWIQDMADAVDAAEQLDFQQNQHSRTTAAARAESPE